MAGAAVNLWLPWQIPTEWLINLTVFTVSHLLQSGRKVLRVVDWWLGPPLMKNAISYEFPVLNDVLLSDNKANTDTGNWRIIHCDSCPGGTMAKSAVVDCLVL